jgi:hypothetical protein
MARTSAHHRFLSRASLGKVVLVLFISLGPNLAAAAAAHSSQTIEIAPVLQAIHDALEEAAQNQQPGFPDLT